jgi:hypothetical protein
VGAAGWAAAEEFAAGAVPVVLESDFLHAAAGKSNKKMPTRAWNFSCLISSSVF